MTERPPEDDGRLQLTRARLLAVAGLCGLVIGWLIVTTITAAGSMVPAAPISFPVLLTVIAVAVVVYAWGFRRRVRAPETLVSAHEGLGALVLGKSLALLGALLIGGMLVYATDLTKLAYPAPRERVVMASISIVASALLGFAGLWLERSCVVAGDDDSSDTDSSDDDSHGASRSR